MRFLVFLTGLTLLCGCDGGNRRVNLEKAERVAAENYWEGKGRSLKGKIKERWGFLTDDVFLESQGRTEYIAGKIQERTGMNQKEAIEELKAMERALQD